MRILPSAFALVVVTTSSFSSGAFTVAAADSGKYPPRNALESLESKTFPPLSPSHSRSFSQGSSTVLPSAPVVMPGLSPALPAAPVVVPGLSPALPLMPVAPQVVSPTVIPPVYATPYVPYSPYSRYPVYPGLQSVPMYNPYAQPYRRSYRNPYGDLPFAGNMPFIGDTPFGLSNGGIPFFGSQGSAFPNSLFGKNNKMPFVPSYPDKKRKKAWGDDRNIWPDFYTDFTDEAWDAGMSGPRDLGVMPGGWRLPYLSTPDPVTVSDAIANQFPPMFEESGNMADFTNWGIFKQKR